MHVRVKKKRVYEYRGSELDRTRNEGASMLVRVTGKRVRWDEEQEASTLGRVTSLPAYEPTQGSGRV